MNNSYVVFVSSVAAMGGAALTMSLSIVFLWGGNYLVSQFFPAMLAALHSRVFFVFALMCGLCLAFIWRFVPETRGRTLEEIERELFGSSPTPEAYSARTAHGATAGET